MERVLRLAAAFLFLASASAVAVHDPAASSASRVTAAGAGEQALLALRDAVTTTTTTTTTTTAPPPLPTTTTAVPPPARPKPTVTAAPRPASGVTVPHIAAVGKLSPPAVATGLTPYVGMGTWVDVFDWSPSYTNGRPGAGPDDVDRMVAAGVQTLYIQASKHDAPGDLVDPDLLQAIVDRAHGKGLRVVGWYLPTLTDPQRDLQRLLAVAAMRNVDSVAVDIEARNVSDVNERNRRLVELSRALRDSLPGRTIGAIVLPPVVTEVINPNYWPSFPWGEIASSYDVWQTMGYWTNRTQASGYRDAYRYTKDNVDRLRADLGQPQLPVHPIGGIGDQTTPADVEGFRRAAIETHSIGGSLYDWRTTRADCWTGMAGFRA